MKKKTLFAVLILFMSFFIVEVSAYGADIYRINGVEASEESKDLESFGKAIEGCKVVGLGEGTHGTREFFKVKHRLLKYLVEEKGYRAFAMEESLGVMNEINSYIQGEDYNLNELALEMLMPWENKETLDMINWARDYNKKAKKEDKIRFYGFDNQENSNNKIVKTIESYYKSLGGGSFKFYKSTIYKLDGESDNFFKDIDNNLEENKDEYIKKTSLKEYSLMKKITENKVNFFEGDKKETRDQLMAENVIWINNYEKEFYNNDKLVLWAHNIHISFYEKYMGRFLKDHYKDDYYALDMEFYSGKFIGRFSGNSKARYATLYNLKESSNDSFSGNIHKLYPDENMLYINIKDVKKDSKLNKVLNEKLFLGEYGAGSLDFSTDNGEKKSIKECFDGILYFKNISPANYIGINAGISSVDISRKSIFLRTLIYNILILLAIVIPTSIYDKRKDKKDDDNKLGVLIIIYCLFFIFNIVSLNFAEYFIWKNGFTINNLINLLIILALLGILFKSKSGVILFFAAITIKSILCFEEMGIFTCVVFAGIIMAYLVYRKRKVFFKAYKFRR